MAAKTSTGNIALNLIEVLQTCHNMKTTYIRAVTQKTLLVQFDPIPPAASCGKPSRAGTKPTATSSGAGH